MKKYICYYLLLAVSLLFTQSACEDGKDEFLSDFSTILYFRDSGAISMTLYKTGEKTNYRLAVVKAGSELGTTTSVSAKVMEDAELVAYNAAEGTNYKMIPADCYTIDTSDLNFGTSDLYKTVDVSISPESVENYLDENSTFVIPFELVNSPDSINAEKKYAFLHVVKVLTPTIGFENTGYIATEDITDNSGTVTIQQKVVMPINNQWNFDFVVEVDEDVLTQYNTDNAESLNMLTQGAYKIEAAAFTAGTNSATVNISIDKSKLSWGRQALPLRIKSISNENFEIDAASATCIVGVNYTVLRSSLNEINLSLNMLSSNATVEGDGTGLTGLFDGRASNKHWHGNYSGSVFDPVYGQYIDFHLNSAINHFAYNLWTRFENANGAPVSTDIYVGNDGSTWTKLGTATSTLTKGDEEYASGVFSSGTSFTYVRVAVTKSKAGNCLTGSYWNCGEMKIYGK